MKTSVLIRIILIAIIAVIIVSAVAVQADSKADRAVSWRYTGVKVSDGDTLWSIAKTYCSEDMDINVYIEKLMSINQIRDEQSLTAGKYITVCYEAP